jgi:hypothetical protein
LGWGWVGVGLGLGWGGVGVGLGWVGLGWGVLDAGTTSTTTVPICALLLHLYLVHLPFHVYAFTVSRVCIYRFVHVWLSHVQLLCACPMWVHLSVPHVRPGACFSASPLRLRCGLRRRASIDNTNDPAHGCRPGSRWS